MIIIYGKRSQIKTKKRKVEIAGYQSSPVSEKINNSTNQNILAASSLLSILKSTPPPPSSWDVVEFFSLKRSIRIGKEEEIDLEGHTV